MAGDTKVSLVGSNAMSVSNTHNRDYDNFRRYDLMAHRYLVEPCLESGKGWLSSPNLGS